VLPALVRSNPFLTIETILAQLRKKPNQGFSLRDRLGLLAMPPQFDCPQTMLPRLLQILQGLLQAPNSGLRWLVGGERNSRAKRENAR
jgi:hypothetical protein